MDIKSFFEYLEKYLPKSYAALMHIATKHPEALHKPCPWCGHHE